MCDTGNKEQPPLNERKKKKQTKDFKKMNMKKKLETWKFIFWTSGLSSRVIRTSDASKRINERWNDLIARSSSKSSSLLSTFFSSPSSFAGLGRVALVLVARRAPDAAVTKSERRDKEVRFRTGWFSRGRDFRGSGAVMILFGIVRFGLIGLSSRNFREHYTHTYTSTASIECQNLFF